MLTVWRLAQVCRVESQWQALNKQKDKMEHIHHFAQYLTVHSPQDASFF